MASSRPSRAERIHRPLGITLAIVATALLYGVLPILETYFMHRLDMTTSEAFIQGEVDIGTWKWVQAIYGGVMLVICGLAWWGRPPWIRFVLMGAILLATGITLLRVVEAWTTDVNQIFGGQAQDVQRDYLLRCWLPGSLLVPLYVIWYLNRAPARAFYRRVPLVSLSDRHE
jgi:hypothetical protein